jgi:hypothetical protein
MLYQGMLQLQQKNLLPSFLGELVLQCQSQYEASKEKYLKCKWVGLMTSIKKSLPGFHESLMTEGPDLKASPYIALLP